MVDAPMARSVSAGLVYVAIVFAAGFGLGVLRVLVLLPHVGALAAVIIEIPVILGISWFICGWLLARFAIPPAAVHRIAMGGVALTVLLAMEAGVSIFVFGESFAGHLAHYRELPAQIGLAGQCVFSAIPWLRSATRDWA